MTRYFCGFCSTSFPSLTELNLHRAHEHPQDMSRTEWGTYNFYKALLSKYRK